MTSFERPDTVSVQQLLQGKEWQRMAFGQRSHACGPADVVVVTGNGAVWYREPWPNATRRDAGL